MFSAQTSPCAEMQKCASTSSMVATATRAEVSLPSRRRSIPRSPSVADTLPCEMRQLSLHHSALAPRHLQGQAVTILGYIPYSSHWPIATVPVLCFNCLHLARKRLQPSPTTILVLPDPTAKRKSMGGAQRAAQSPDYPVRGASLSCDTIREHYRTMSSSRGEDVGATLINTPGVD